MHSFHRFAKVAGRGGLLAAFFLPVANVHAFPARDAASAEQALSLLTANAGGDVTHAARAIDAYAMVHSTGQAPLLVDDATAPPVERARFFLSTNGALFGVRDSVSELLPNRISKDGFGNTHVHLDQTYKGLPVFGARVIVHMNSLGIVGTNGVFFNDIGDLSTAPQMSGIAIKDRALAAARRLHPKASLSVESSRLLVYRTGVLKGVASQKNFLAYEVIVKGDRKNAVREQLFINADTGALLNRINRIETVLNREIHTPTIDTTPVLTEGSALAPADPAFAGDTKGNPGSSRTHGPGTVPTDNLYIYAGGTYIMYKNLFGREGYDDGTIDPTTGVQRMQIQKSVYLVNDQCPNAYWDGTSTNYCPGFDADDVVSHEWSHAYTEYTDDLVYQYQSGALNESNSDIFGETYDLIDGFEGPLGASLTEGDYYENGGSRWVVGEDLSQAAAILLLRDMWDPDNFPTPSPGSSISSANYECDTADNGGVHTNSGVSNHAYAMLVDGKTFNGVTVPGIGITKAAHIYFQAKTHYGTPTQNFPQHADGLEQACADLIGKPIDDVFGKVSPEVIGKADCDAVHAVTLAVEFRGNPGGTPATVAEKCNYVPVLKPEASTPPLCAVGMAPVSTFSQGFDSEIFPPAGWTQGKNLTGDKDIDPWTTSTDLPAPHTGRAAFFRNDTGGTCAAGGDESASHFLDSPDITVVTAADRFTFTHFVQAEQGFDGGNLKYSLNGGAFAIVPSAAFIYNDHSGVFSDAPLAPGVPDPVGVAGNNTSPNAGEVAWTGSDQGEATGSWGTSIVDISKLTGSKIGDKVKFRFDFANDGCGGNLGWFIDSTDGYYCAAASATTGGTSGGSNGGTSGGSTGGATGGTSGGTSGSGTSGGGSGGASSGGSSGGGNSGSGSSGGGSSGGGSSGGGSSGGGSSGGGSSGGGSSGGGGSGGGGSSGGGSSGGGSSGGGGSGGGTTGTNPGGTSGGTSGGGGSTGGTTGTTPGGTSGGATGGTTGTADHGSNSSGARMGGGAFGIPGLLTFLGARLLRGRKRRRVKG